MNLDWRSILNLAVLGLVCLPGRVGAQTAQPPATPSSADTILLRPATPVESLLVAPLPEKGERWSLSRCVTTALERNADIRVARARARQASGTALSAWQGIVPSVRTEAAYEQIRPDQTRATILGPSGEFLGILTRRETALVSATASSNILSAPAIGEKRRLDHLSRGSELDEQETRNQVVYRVKQQYFNVLKAERLAQVARETEKLARDEETRAEALFQVGTQARGDLLKARARRATTQADRIRAENQVQIQAAQLRQVIGVDPSQPILPEVALDPMIVIPDSSESVRLALSARPRMESAKAVERAARSGVFSAKSERLPRFTANLSVERSRIDENLEGPIGDVPPYWATNWYGDVRASLPIFDGLAIEGGVRQAKGTLLEAESQRRQRELDVAVEVQQAWLTLREAVQRIDVAREGLASAEEDYKFSKGRYELGAGTYLDLLTADVGLANARQTLIEAVADARVAEAGLEAAIGAKRY